MPSTPKYWEFDHVKTDLRAGGFFSAKASTYRFKEALVFGQRFCVILIENLKKSDSATKTASVVYSLPQETATVLCRSTRPVTFKICKTLLPKGNLQFVIALFQGSVGNSEKSCQLLNHSKAYLEVETQIQGSVGNNEKSCQLFHPSKDHLEVETQIFKVITRNMIVPADTGITLLARDSVHFESKECSSQPPKHPQVNVVESWSPPKHNTLLASKPNVNSCPIL